MKVSRWSLAALFVAVLSAVSFAQGTKPAATTPAPRKPAASTPRPRTAVHRAANSQRLDGVAAVVNDDVVLQSDLEEQLEAYLRQLDPQQPIDSATVDTLRHQILDQLVNEKLIVAEAKKQGVSVNDADVSREVDKAIDQIKERLGGDEGFQRQLKAENTTEARLRDKYRQELERQMLAERMRDKVIPRKSVLVSPAEAEAYFKAHPDKFPKRPAEVRLSVVQIPVMPDSASDAAGKAKILAIRKRITSGERFAKVAAEVSEDPGSARAGGDLGFFMKGQMDPGFDAAAFSLPIGKLSDPVHSVFGWHLIEVIERDTVRTRAKTMSGADSSDAHGNAVMRDSLDVKGNPAVESHARHILVRVPTDEKDAERALNQADRVHEQAIKGTDFVTLVHRYSRYQGPATADGDIGFVPMSALQPNIRAGLDTLEVGQVSPVLQNAIGWNIFKLTDRKPERTYELAEIRNQLPGAVEQIKLRERYDEWIKGLRSRAHVQIKA